jgi:betaine reductase
MDREMRERGYEVCGQVGVDSVGVVVVAAAGEAAGRAAAHVALGDPTFAGCLAGVSLKLPCYHICEPEIKEEIDEAVYDEQISMMEMVLDVDDICDEMNAIREQVED